MRQGPHHGAHRSMSKSELVLSAASIVLSSASTSQGRSVEHLAHLGRPLLLTGTRFLAPQLEHFVMFPAMSQLNTGLSDKAIRLPAGVLSGLGEANRSGRGRILLGTCAEMDGLFARGCRLLPAGNARGRTG